MHFSAAVPMKWSRAKVRSRRLPFRWSPMTMPCRYAVKPQLNTRRASYRGPRQSVVWLKCIDHIPRYTQSSGLPWQRIEDVPEVRLGDRLGAAFVDGAKRSGALRSVVSPASLRCLDSLAEVFASQLLGQASRTARIYQSISRFLKCSLASCETVSAVA